MRNSANAKLGDRVSATYLSQESCPATCPFLDNGCYAEQGNSGIHTKRLAKSPINDPVALAKAEVNAIQRGLVGQELPPDQALRLHVVGDARTIEAVRILVTGLKHWLYGPVWAYTHAWQKVARRVWGTQVSILASCEDLTGVVKAMRRGYAAALVVTGHKSSKTYTIQTRTMGQLRVIPCPNQTLGKTCRECKLCWKDQWLLASRTVIAFAAHGSRKNTVINIIEEKHT